MLDHALEVAARRYDLEQKQAEFHADLMKLPVEELQKIASTGEIKLAFFCGPMEEGTGVTWLDHFKGTPFFEQAIALEQEELQAQMAQQQAQQVNRQKDQQGWDQMDQIRLKKRLLELQRARNEAQVLSGGGGPPNQTGSGAGSEAQGAGALGPVAPEGQQEGSGDTNKMGSVKRAKLEIRGPQTDAELEQYLSPEEKERLKMASAIKKAMDPALMSSLKRTAGAGPALKGQLSNVGQKLTGMAAGQVSSAARKGTFLQNAPAAKPVIQGHFQADPFTKAASIPSASAIGHHVGKKIAPAYGAVSAGVGAWAGSNDAKQLKAKAKEHPDNKLLQFAAKHPKTYGALLVGTAGAGGSYAGSHFGAHLGKALSKHGEAAQGADAWGREMARADMAKVARAKEIFATGDTLGRAMAKTSGVLSEVGQWAMKHPSQAGAIAGGTLGAAHGLLKEDGGIGQAVGEGIVGAGAGHAIGGVGSRMMKGKNFGDALSGYATNTDRKLRVFGAKASNEAAKLSDKLKGSLAEAKAPEQALSGPQVQAAE